MPRGVKKENLPWKLCEVCQRPFTWRKVWERCWDDVKTCSDRCKAERKKQNNKAKKEEESNSGSTKETSHDARQVVEMDKRTTAQINSFAGIMPLHHQLLLFSFSLHRVMALNRLPCSWLGQAEVVSV
jgi:hypothetical protein